MFFFYIKSENYEKIKIMIQNKKPKLVSSHGVNLGAAINRFIWMKKIHSKARHGNNFGIYFCHHRILACHMFSAMAYYLQVGPVAFTGPRICVIWSLLSTSSDPYVV